MRFPSIAVIVGALLPGLGWAAPSMLHDRNGDGRFVVACLGDSNTQSNWQEAKPGGFPADQGWCEGLGRLLEGRGTAVNIGTGGATVVERIVSPTDQASAEFSYHASGQMEIALRKHRPDVVIFAFGTNDLVRDHEASLDEIIGLYEKLRRRALEAGVFFLVATVPPAQSEDYLRLGNRFRGGGLDRNQERIEMLNRRLHATFPARHLVDFSSGFPVSSFLDRVHLNAAGQHLRATRAHAALLSGPSAPETTRQLEWKEGRWLSVSPRDQVPSPFGLPRYLGSQVGKADEEKDVRSDIE